MGQGNPMVCLVGLILAICVGWSAAQDSPKKVELRPFTDGLDNLPWGELDLNASQQAKIKSIRTVYQHQLDELAAKEKATKNECFADCMKILTDAQIATLKKAAQDKAAPTKTDKAADVDKADKTDKDK
jgi:Spy/CpxP family protein refolding chaperone